MTRWIICCCGSDGPLRAMICFWVMKVVSDMMMIRTTQVSFTASRWR